MNVKLIRIIVGAVLLAVAALVEQNGNNNDSDKL